MTGMKYMQVLLSKNVTCKNNFAHFCINLNEIIIITVKNNYHITYNCEICALQYNKTKQSELFTVYNQIESENWNEHS